MPGPLLRPLPILFLTRPEAASARFAEQCGDSGLRFDTVISPLFRIEATGPLPDASAAGGLIFTSANGVAVWLAQGGRRDLPVYTVGDATARAAEAAGMRAHSAGGAADDLIDWLIAHTPDLPLMHLHGRHTRGDVAERLTKAGLTCGSAVIYDQPAQPLSAEARAALLGTTPVIVPVFSPRTGELLAQERAQAPLLVAAMSEAVVNALGPLHKRDLKVAARPESEAMREVVSDLLKRALAGDY
ncbi:uroporphyrinogen-III synthase [Antarctobacter heliothermus]|uniref:Uroporphyrinogen-III synthase n=1 Tax=Antarctobacter heliothermus TaxID=74033 RepID=A0A239BM02_9RHOB|nr:uroporphyrinogen-III synthase [Antarctobacter heliothermus]SNS09165.1 uroporphyrinogen-III synthase [Antarctobacter heliothermus]